jgi:hypothetical protein
MAYRSLSSIWLSSLVKIGRLSVPSHYLSAFLTRSRLSVGAELSDMENENDQATRIIAREREVNLLLTCLYLFVEVARRRERVDRSDTVLRDAIGKGH